MKINQVIKEAFIKADVDMQAVTFVESDYGMGGDSEKYDSAHELLEKLSNMLNNIEDDLDEEEDDIIWFEFKGEVFPWWDENEYVGREALLTVNIGDNTSFAIIQ